MSTGCGAGNGEGVERESSDHGMVGGYIANGIDIVDDRSKDIGAVIGER